MGFTRRSLSRARVTTPAWPSPAMTASNSSGFLSGPHVMLSPAPVTTSSSSTWSPCVPWRNEATPIPAIDSVPPTVTFRLFVRTGCARPRGFRRSRRLPQSTPPSTSAVSRSASTEITRSRAPMAIRMPPSESPRWLWLCPAPRVATVSPSWRAKRIAAATSEALRGSTRRRGVERNRWPKLVVSSSGTSPASRTAPSSEPRSLSRSPLTEPRAPEVEEKEDLAEVPGEMLQHVVVVPADFQQPLRAVGPLADDLAIHVFVRPVLRDLLDVIARAVQEVIVEGDVFPVQERKRRGTGGHGHPVVVLADSEHALDAAALVAFDDHLGPVHLDDREMREKHPDRVHARRGLPHQVIRGEVASNLAQPSKLVVELGMNEPAS